MYVSWLDKGHHRQCPCRCLYVGQMGPVELLVRLVVGIESQKGRLLIRPRMRIQNHSHFYGEGALHGSAMVPLAIRISLTLDFQLDIVFRVVELVQPKA